MSPLLTLERWLTTLRLTARTLLRRKTVDTEFAREMQFHLEREAEYQIVHGTRSGDAMAAARRRFGPLGPIVEAVRDQRHTRVFDELGQDLRFGVRAQIRTPVLTAAAIATLAIGIGATSSLFGLLDQVLLRPLAVPHPEQLYSLIRERPGSIGESVPYPLYAALMSNSSTGQLAGFAFRTATIGQDRDSAIVQLTATQWFKTVGLGARSGRVWSTDDGTRVAVVSDRYWINRLGRTATAVGSSIQIDGLGYQIVGIMPPGFSGVSLDYPVDIWVPISAQPALDGTSSIDGENARGKNWVRLLTRLAPPLGPNQLQSAANLQLSQSRRSGQIIADSTERVVVMSASRPAAGDREQIQRTLLLATALVAFVLLIACTNIANLQFARAITRQREFGIRLAMGAGRARLLRQLMTENIMLALVSGVLGLAVAAGIGRLLGVFATAKLGRSLAPILASGSDHRVLPFTAALSLLTAVAFGLVPALRSTRLDLVTTLRRTALAARSSGRGGLSSWLLIGQMASSILLLVSAGMVAVTLRSATGLDLGFNPVNVFQVSIDWRNVPEEAGRLASREIATSLRAAPGVLSASVSAPSAFGSATISTPAFTTNTQSPSGGQQVEVMSVTPDFLATMQLHPLHGRFVADGDRRGTADVVVLNESAARLLFPGEAAVGKRFDFTGRGHAVEVVGVVADMRLHSVRQLPPPMVMVPYPQDIGTFGVPALRTIEVRTGGPELRADAIAAIASAQSLGRPVQVSRLTDLIAESLAVERLGAWTTAALGLAGLLLAMLGAYGLHAFFVTRRAAELGVRLALGASAGQVLWLVWRQAMRPVAQGTAIGLGLAWASTQLLRGKVLGLTSLDPLVLASAALLMVSVASLACYLPARRASRLSPAISLRAD